MNRVSRAGGGIVYFLLLTVWSACHVPAQELASVGSWPQLVATQLPASAADEQSDAAPVVESQVGSDAASEPSNDGRELAPDSSSTLPSAGSAPTQAAGELASPNISGNQSLEPDSPQPDSPDNSEPDTSAENETPSAEAAARDSDAPLVEADAAPSEDPAGNTPMVATQVPPRVPTGGNLTANSATWLNLRTHILLGVVLVTLAIASIVARYLRQRPTDSINPALVRRFRQRLNAWWLMCAILVFGLLLKSYGTVLLFWLVSFWALREFITMAPTRRGDHRALFWALIVFTPLQYLMIGLERIGLQWSDGRPIDFYGLYSIFIPVYASLFIPARIALSGDHKRFLERSAQITAGLLICVYALSYAPALINLELKDSQGNPWNGSRAGLLFFLVLVSQLADILHWTWGHLVGRRVIAPEISTSRTWEGFAGGTLSTGLIGGILFWVTPFDFWEAMGMSMVIAVMGMFGGMTMSAIKRDRGVNDYGTLVLGHAGVLDRIDTVCFAAPVFYHLTRFFFT